jgi:hypothetical protein
LDQVELADFPKNEWTGTRIASTVQPAEVSLQTSLPLDSENWIANYRLGLILMSRNDFQLAGHYLEVAYQKTPGYRGIIKFLGYYYVWLGNMDQAQLLLA